MLRLSIRLLLDLEAFVAMLFLHCLGEKGRGVTSIDDLRAVKGHMVNEDR